MLSESSGLPETPQQLQRTSEGSPTYRERIPVERNNFLYYFGKAPLSYSILGVDQSFSAKDGLLSGSSLRKFSISYKEKFRKITLNTVNKKCTQRFFFLFFFNWG